MTRVSGNSTTQVGKEAGGMDTTYHQLPQMLRMHPDLLPEQIPATAAGIVMTGGGKAHAHHSPLPPLPEAPPLEAAAAR